MIIVPYESIGPINFGDTQKQVENIFQKSARCFENFDGDIVLNYGSHQYTFHNNSLVEAGFIPSCDIRIMNEAPFCDKNAFETLCRIDGCPYEKSGLIVLLKLGITLAGFHDGDESQLSVTAFVRGRWDEFQGRMKTWTVFR